MTPRKRLMIIFSTLFCITIFIFSSSIILGKHFNFEATVEANTINKSTYRIHTTKLSELEAKTIIAERFIDKEEPLRLYLTFDDGPTEHTGEILEILKKYDIESTFFMLNHNVLKRPEVVQNVWSNNHTIGCHGVTHQIAKFYKDSSSPLDEMNICGKSVESVIGETVNIIRVPFGSFPHLTLAQKEKLDEANLVMWDWNVDSSDWNNHNENAIIQTVLHQVEKLKNSDRVPVILFHDKEVTVRALPRIIEALKSLGYEFLPITENDVPVQFKIKS